MLARDGIAGRVGALWLSVAIIALAPALVPAAEWIDSRADQPPAYRGRPLVEVLNELREEGLPLIFSTAVVTSDLVVTVEPRSQIPREALDEILAPLGLEARQGPAGSILIVARGQAAGELKGRVVSAATGSPVPMATVSIAAVEAAATTGPDGTFVLRDVPAGAHDVIIDALGYMSALARQVRIPAEKRFALIVSLQAQPTYAAEIQVTPGHRSVLRQEQDARRTLLREDAVLVPTIGGDISRVVERLPGVAAPDNSAAFSLRGSTARDVGFVLDGLELYDPFHLLSFQSPFSLVDSEIVDAIELLGGGFTADRGDRLGGFVEMSTTPAADQPRARIEAGSLHSRASYSGTLGGRPGAWMASARYWYPQAPRKTIEFGETGFDPRFGDVYAKLSFAPSSRTLLSAHGLFARDRVKFEESGGGEEVDASADSGYLWLRLLGSWSPAFSSQTVFSIGRIERVREGISEPEDVGVEVSDERIVDLLGLRQDASWQLSESHLLRAGVDVRRIEARYRYELSGEDSPIPSVSHRLEPASTSTGAYVSHRAALSARLALEGGLRWDSQTLRRERQLSPRLSGLWRMGERSELRVGVGRYYQSQRINELRLEDGETAFRSPELSRQAELSFVHRFEGGVRFRFDGYYGRLSGLQPRWENLFNPIELFPETESDRVLVKAEHARLRGAELLVRSKAARPLTWWASYTWSSSDDMIDGRAVPRSWDQTHAAGFLIGYHLDSRWLVSLSGTARSGWPTTPLPDSLDEIPEAPSLVESIRESRNTARLPWYGRLDLKASRWFALGRARLRVQLDVVNATNRDNACCVEDVLFERREDGTVRVEPVIGHWLGITPSVSLLVEF